MAGQGGISFGMLLTPRSTPVLEVIQGSGSAAVSRYLPPGKESPRPVLPPGSTFHYHGIPPPGRISWVAVLFSAGLHAAVLLGFNHHAPARKIVVESDLPGELLIMPDLKDEEVDKPKELVDDEEMQAPAVSVPMLADIPLMVPVDSSFVQQLDMTIPLKSDPMAGKLVSIPVNILHGRPDDRGIRNLFNISELDRAPEPIVQTPPDFPFELKREGITGRVRVGFIVDSQGNVILPYIVSSTNVGFERPAIDALKRWKFRPGMKGGRKDNTRVEQPIDFKVSENGP